MITAFLRTSAFFAALTVLPVATMLPSPDATRYGSASCTGTELAQNAPPNGDAPGANMDTAPDIGSEAPEQSQSPQDGDDDGADTEETVPPNTAEPHGCIFRNEPLDLIV